MVDKNTAVATFGADRLQDEDNQSQLSGKMGDLGDTSGMRMSALCLNLLQDFSDAASQCSTIDRRLPEKKKSQKKGFADWFKINRKGKSKKSADRTPDDKSDASKTHSKWVHRGKSALVPHKGDGADRKGKEEKGIDGNFDVSGNKSATVPRNTGQHSNSKENTTPSPPAAAAASETGKKKKLFKEKGNTLPRAETVEGKTNLKTGAKERFDTSMQNFVTKVNQKFPTSDGLADKEKNKRSEEPEVSQFDDISLEGYSDRGSLHEDDHQMFKPRMRHLAELEVRNRAPVVQQIPASPRGRTRQRNQQEKWRTQSVGSNGTEASKRRRIGRRALSREYVVVKTTTREETTTFPSNPKRSSLPAGTSITASPLYKNIRHPEGTTSTSPFPRSVSNPEDKTTTSPLFKVSHPEDQTRTSPFSKASQPDEMTTTSPLSEEVIQPEDRTITFPFSKKGSHTKDKTTASPLSEDYHPDDTTTTSPHSKVSHPEAKTTTSPFSKKVSHTKDTITASPLSDDNHPDDTTTTSPLSIKVSHPEDTTTSPFLRKASFPNDKTSSSPLSKVSHPEDKTTISPMSEEVSYPDDMNTTSPLAKKVSHPGNTTVISPFSKKVRYPESTTTTSPLSNDISHPEDATSISPRSKKVNHPEDMTTIFPPFEVITRLEGTTSVSTFSEAEPHSSSSAENGEIPLAKIYNKTDEAGPNHVEKQREPALLPQSLVQTNDRLREVRKRLGDLRQNGGINNGLEDSLSTGAEEYHISSALMERQQENARKTDPAAMLDISNVVQLNDYLEKSSIGEKQIRNQHKKAVEMQEAAGLIAEGRKQDFGIHGQPVILYSNETTGSAAGKPRWTRRKPATRVRSVETSSNEDFKNETLGEISNRRRGSDIVGLKDGTFEIVDPNDPSASKEKKPRWTKRQSAARSDRRPFVCGDTPPFEIGRNEPTSNRRYSYEPTSTETSSVVDDPLYADYRTGSNETLDSDTSDTRRSPSDNLRHQQSLEQEDNLSDPCPNRESMNTSNGSTPRAQGKYGLDERPLFRCENPDFTKSPSRPRKLNRSFTDDPAVGYEHSFHNLLPESHDRLSRNFLPKDKSPHLKHTEDGTSSNTLSEDSATEEPLKYGKSQGNASFVPGKNIYGSPSASEIAGNTHKPHPVSSTQFNRPLNVGQNFTGNPTSSYGPDSFREEINSPHSDAVANDPTYFLNTSMYSEPSEFEAIPDRNEPLFYGETQSISCDQSDFDGYSFRNEPSFYGDIPFDDKGDKSANRSTGSDSSPTPFHLDVDLGPMYNDGNEKILQLNDQLQKFLYINQICNDDLLRAGDDRMPSVQYRTRNENGRNALTEQWQPNLEDANPLEMFDEKRERVHDHEVKDKNLNYADLLEQSASVKEDSQRISSRNQQELSVRQKNGELHEEDGFQKHTMLSGQEKEDSTAEGEYAGPGRRMNSEGDTGAFMYSKQTTLPEWDMETSAMSGSAEFVPQFPDAIERQRKARLSRKAIRGGYEETQTVFRCDSASNPFLRDDSQLRESMARRYLPDDDRSSFSSLPPRRIYIDIPYSDSGYSETEGETLSPCSFRSSLSRTDTVTEEGRCQSATEERGYVFQHADDGVAQAEKQYPGLNSPDSTMKGQSWSSPVMRVDDKMETSWSSDGLNKGTEEEEDEEEEEAVFSAGHLSHEAEKLLAPDDDDLRFTSERLTTCSDDNIANISTGKAAEMELEDNTESGKISVEIAMPRASGIWSMATPDDCFPSTERDDSPWNTKCIETQRDVEFNLDEGNQNLQYADSGIPDMVETIAIQFDDDLAIDKISVQHSTTPSSTSMAAADLLEIQQSGVFNKISPTSETLSEERKVMVNGEMLPQVAAPMTRKDGFGVQHPETFSELSSTAEALNRQESGTHAEEVIVDNEILPRVAVSTTGDDAPEIQHPEMFSEFSSATEPLDRQVSGSHIETEVNVGGEMLPQVAAPMTREDGLVIKHPEMSSEISSSAEVLNGQESGNGAEQEVVSESRVLPEVTHPMTREDRFGIQHHEKFSELSSTTEALNEQEIGNNIEEEMVVGGRVVPEGKVPMTIQDGSGVQRCGAFSEISATSGALNRQESGNSIEEEVIVDNKILSQVAGPMAREDGLGTQHPEMFSELSSTSGALTRQERGNRFEEEVVVGSKVLPEVTVPMAREDGLRIQHLQMFSELSSTTGTLDKQESDSRVEEVAIDNKILPKAAARMTEEDGLGIQDRGTFREISATTGALNRQETGNGAEEEVVVGVRVLPEATIPMTREDGFGVEHRSAFSEISAMTGALNRQEGGNSIKEEVLVLADNKILPQVAAPMAKEDGLNLGAFSEISSTTEALHRQESDNGAEKEVVSGDKVPPEVGLITESLFPEKFQRCQDPSMMANYKVPQKEFPQIVNNERKIWPIVYSSVVENNQTVKCQTVPLEERSVPPTINKVRTDEDVQKPVSIAKEIAGSNEVVTWFEYAEVMSMYRSRRLSDEKLANHLSGKEVDLSLLPSTWVWNSARYKNKHQLKDNTEKVIRLPDPRPCQNYKSPISPDVFNSVDDRKVTKHEPTSDRGADTVDVECAGSPISSNVENCSSLGRYDLSDVQQGDAGYDVRDAAVLTCHHEAGTTMEDSRPHITSNDETTVQPSSENPVDKSSFMDATLVMEDYRSCTSPNDVTTVPDGDNDTTVYSLRQRLPPSSESPVDESISRDVDQVSTDIRNKSAVGCLLAAVADTGESQS